VTPAQWRAAKRSTEVLGYAMASVESGTGRPIVLLPGDPTSSYLWRSILPADTPEDNRRVLAVLAALIVALRAEGLPDLRTRAWIALRSSGMVKSITASSSVHARYPERVRRQLVCR
jgi:pimeloyl-ACP methyl ester carboxylesterase